MRAVVERQYLQVIDLNLSIFAKFSWFLVIVEKHYGKMSVSCKTAGYFQATFRSMVALRYRRRSTVRVPCRHGERFASCVVLSAHSAAHPAPAL